MRKIIAGFASSLDGYIEGPHGEYDWILIDQEIDFAEHMNKFDTYLFGRKSYEKFAAAGSGNDGMKKLVFSKTLTSLPENFTLVKENISEKMNSLKNEQGKDIAFWGGASLLSSFLELRLIDEISIAIIPVLLGQGKSMVGSLKDKVWLSLINSRSYSNGTLQANYKVIYTKGNKK
ncbi:MAG: dihydrofolate reductase family protein [Ginsengibacter sp.]